MRRTFNLGIGLVVIVAPSDVEEVETILSEHGENPIRIGIVR